MSDIESGTDVSEVRTYDTTDRLTTVTRGTQRDVLDYDPDGRLTNLLRVIDPGSPESPVTAIEWQQYGYDKVGNRTYTNKLLQADRSEHYGYDNRNRLTVMDRGELNSGGTEIETPLAHAALANTQQWVNLDARGNWLEYRGEVNGALRIETRTVEATGGGTMNQYRFIDPDGPADGPPCTTGCQPALTATYDTRGNLTKDPFARVVGDGATASGQGYKYDEENRVTEIHRNYPTGPLLLEFKYDAIGRRVETIEYVDPESGDSWDGEAPNPQPRKTRHIYTGLEAIQDYCEDVAGCPALLREFIWGDSANFPEPVAMVDYSSTQPPGSCAPPTGCVYYYLRDVLGSVTGLYKDGAIAERYTYDPYGRTYIEKSDGTGNWTATNASSFGNPFMWTGQRYDAATGTYYTLFRTYSPQLGMWLQRDPIGFAGGTINLYEYVLGNPVIFVDPLGLSPQELKKRLRELCAYVICPAKAEKQVPTGNGQTCSWSDKGDYKKCLAKCNEEVDKIVKCIEGVVASGNRGSGTVCTNINPYIEYLLGIAGLDFFRVEAFRPIRIKDGKPGRHVVTGIGSSDEEDYPVIVDPLDWNNLWPPNLEIMLLEPNQDGNLEDHLPIQSREPHHPWGPRRPAGEPPPWERNPNIFPP